MKIYQYHKTSNSLKNKIISLCINIFFSFYLCEKLWLTIWHEENVGNIYSKVNCTKDYRWRKTTLFIFCCCDKTSDQDHLRKKYLAYISKWQFTTEGSQGRSSSNSKKQKEWRQVEDTLIIWVAISDLCLVIIFIDFIHIWCIFIKSTPKFL